MINNKRNLEEYVEIFNNLYQFISIIDIDNSNYKVLSKNSFLGIPRNGDLAEGLEFSDKLIHKDDIDTFNNNINPKYLRKYFEITNNKYKEIYYRVLIGKDNYRWFNSIVIPIKDTNNLFLYFSKAIYEEDELRTDFMKEFEQKNTRYGIDKLTGCYNKSNFYSKISEKIVNDSEKKYAIIRFDINKFKVINESYGEIYGDNVLVYIANSIKEYIKDKGTFLFGRIESDVFSIFYEYSKENTDTIISKIENIIKEYELPITCSYGVYIVEDNTMPPSLMCDRAYLAQQEIKGDSINNIGYYDDNLRLKYLNEAQITSHMYKALQDEAFEIYLQPKCCLSTKKPVGAEVLVRWKNSNGGIINPNRFIPIFEKNNFIVKLDEYVWEKSCLIIKKIEEELGIKMPISVNISRNNMNTGDFVNVLINLVRKYDINPKLLHIEITESAFAEDDKLKKSIKELRDYGFYVEIDDFGSGYSSLNILRDIEADAIKLDMNFLKEEVLSEKTKSILISIVKMGRELKLNIIPEGIENEGHLKYLRNIGCLIGQGYLFAKPDTEENFMNYLKKSYKNQTEFNHIVDLIRNKEEYRIEPVEMLNYSKYEKFPSALAVFSLDENGTLLYCNDVFLKLIGYTREEFAKIHANRIINIIYKEDFEEIKKLKRKTIKEDVFSVDLRFIRKDNEKRLVRVNAQIDNIGNKKRLVYCNIIEK